MNKKSVILRILAAAGALFIIALIFTFATAFLGNPISAAVASSQSEKYVKENYAEKLEYSYTVEKAKYDFKFGGYYAKVISGKSSDYNFTVYWNGNNNLRDDYESSVINKGNLFMRLEKEFGDNLLEVTSQIPGFDCTTLSYAANIMDYEAISPALTNGMAYSKALPLEVNLNVYLELDDYGASAEELAGLFEYIYNAAQSAGFSENAIYSMSLYSFREFDTAESDKDGERTKIETISINDVMPEYIESGNLTEMMRIAMARTEEESEAVYGRELTYYNSIKE